MTEGQFNKPQMVKGMIEEQNKVGWEDKAKQVDAIASNHKAMLEHTALRSAAAKHARIVTEILDNFGDPRMKDVALAVAADLLDKLAKD